MREYALHLCGWVDSCGALVQAQLSTLILESESLTEVHWLAEPAGQ